MDKISIPPIFLNKKGQESGDYRVTMTVIIIILALLVAVGLYYMIGGIGNAFMPKK